MTSVSPRSNAVGAVSGACRRRQTSGYASTLNCAWRAVFILLALFVATGAAAQTSWTGAAADNNWSSPANWNTGTVPNASTVDVVLGVDTTINVDGTFTVRDLDISGPVMLQTGTIDLSGTATLQADPGTLQIATTISGAGSLVVVGGTVILSAANTFTGNVSIEAGELAITGPGGLGAGAVFFSGGGLVGEGSFALARMLNITAGNTGRVSATAGSVLTLTGSLDRLAGSTLRIGTPGNTGTVVASNAVLGFGGQSAVAVDAGTLRIGNVNAASSLLGFDGVNGVSGVTLGAGTVLDLNGFAVDVNGLTGTGKVRTGAGVATLDLDGASSFAGVIEDGAGTVNLLKDDATTTTLSGDST
ncbi:MAG: hypothetical protein RQ826_17575, partial [Xanthomonadales bacterium]|nr:hypothetical protein [Xanthomonadales bacterium]